MVVAVEINAIRTQKIWNEFWGAYWESALSVMPLERNSSEGRKATRQDTAYQRMSVPAVLSITC